MQRPELSAHEVDDGVVDGVEHAAHDAVAAEWSVTSTIVCRESPCACRMRARSTAIGPSSSSMPFFSRWRVWAATRPVTLAM